MKLPRPIVTPGTPVLYFPAGAAEPHDALVCFVHSQHVVDVDVDNGEGAEPRWTRRNIVPFLCDGEPDPLSPLGRCQLAPLRAEPAPVVLNAGTAYEFTIDPATGEPL